MNLGLERALRLIINNALVDANRIPRLESLLLVVLETFIFILILVVLEWLLLVIILECLAIVLLKSLC